MKMILLEKKWVSIFSVVCLVIVTGVQMVDAADPTIVGIMPVSQTVEAGDTFNISVTCSPQQPIKAFEVKVSFNSSLLQATSVREGDLFDGFETFFSAGTINNSAGTIVDIYDLIVGVGNVTDTGSLLVINFTAKSLNGTSSVSLYDVQVTNESDYVEVTVSSGVVNIIGGGTSPVPPPDNPPVDPPSLDENMPPFVPLKPVGATQVIVGTLYNYSSAAIDADDDFVRLRFDWGDGSLSNWSEFVASNKTVSMSYAWTTVSNQSIQVIAQDIKGMNSSWSDFLIVMVVEAHTSGGLLPQGMFTLPETIVTNRTVLFNTSALYDPDGTIVSYQWDFGDGVVGVGKNPVHTYEIPGRYTVTLTVIDDTGLNTTMTKVVTVMISSEVVVPNNNIVDFIQSNSAIIIFVTIALLILIIFIVFRDRIEKFYVDQRIKTSRRRLALGLGLSDTTREIDQIVDKLFDQIDLMRHTPSKEMILNAYTDVVGRRSEKNLTYPPPDRSIKEIEKLVDQRIQKLIEEEIDKL